jgi:hypothetical protein
MCHKEIEITNLLKQYLYKHDNRYIVLYTKGEPYFEIWKIDSTTIYTWFDGADKFSSTVSDSIPDLIQHAVSCGYTHLVEGPYLSRTEPIIWMIFTQPSQEHATK